MSGLQLDADHKEADHLSKLRGKEIRSLTHELQNAHASNETFSKVCSLQQQECICLVLPNGGERASV